MIEVFQTLEKEESIKLSISFCINKQDINIKTQISINNFLNFRFEIAGLGTATHFKGSRTPYTYIKYIKKNLLSKYLRI